MKANKFNEETLNKTLIQPIVSEKSTLVGEKSNHYVFKVDLRSTKEHVRQAVESIFKVSVEKVQILKIKGKTKRFGKFFGKRSSWKKAYVSVQKGQDINFINEDSK